MKAGHTPTEIAEVLGRHKSTICRELKRNRGLRGYRTKQARELSCRRRQAAHGTRISTADWNRVEELVRQDWSPEQVSGWLCLEEGITISHEWIYLYIYADKCDGRGLHKHRRCQKQRRKRYGSYERRGQLKGRVSIDERPAVVERRSRIGDWEADTVIGKPGGAVLVTLAERKTRQSILVLSPDKSARAVKQAII